jgi:diguanylate cyclase (GGDEF)-like protein
MEASRHEARSAATDNGATGSGASPGLREALLAAGDESVRKLLTELVAQGSKYMPEGTGARRNALQALLLGMRKMALTDEMTALRNRRGFLEAGQHLLERQTRGGGRAALFFIDLDNLKATNDSFGHAAGDSLIVRTAQLLKHVFRGHDVLARIGGDEFVALVATNHRNVGPIIQRRLAAALAADNASRGRCRLSFSVGVAQFDPAQPMPLAALLKVADIAMYGNKHAHAQARQAQDVAAPLVQPVASHG